VVLVAGTYTDVEKCKGYLALSLFDSDTIDAQIALQSANARDKVDTFLGRTTHFTTDELEKVQFEGILDAASQLTACLVQAKPQAAAMEYTEDTRTDCAEAVKTLTNWAKKNGVTLPDNVETRKRVSNEIVYLWSSVDTIG
jgi:hypothetical protein